MQQKLNLIQVICLRIGKTTETKSHRVNLRSPLLRIYYYQNKRLQVKWISVLYTNLQLNPYPNTQLYLFCSDNISFQCMAPRTWLTNCTDPSTWVDHQLEKDVGCKVLLFITRWRSWSCLVTKPHGVQNTATFWREWRTRVSGYTLLHICAIVLLCHYV